MKPKTLLITIPLILLLSACSFSLAQDVTPPPGYQPPVIQRTEAPVASGPLYPIVAPNPAAGKSIFAEKCAPCHGENGMGDGEAAAQLPFPPAALGSPDIARQSAPADWYRMVTSGNLERRMPPFQSLTDRQRWDVVAYAYSLSTSNEQIAEGQRIFMDQCATCHGETGRGDGPQAADLSTSLPDFSNQEYMAQKPASDFYQATISGAEPDMPSFAGVLSDDQLWLVSGYLRSLSFERAGENMVEKGTETPKAGVETPEETPAPGTLAAADVTLLPEATEVISGLGSITGQVVNQSTGETQGDLEVTLRGFDGMSPVVTETTTLSADGSFAFPEVEMPAGRVFVATVDYEGTTYGSDIMTVEEGIPLLDLSIEVYNTTTDASVLSGDRLHLFFEFVDEQTMRVIELFILSNTSQDTLVAEEEGQPTVTFTLPEGATNLEFQDGVLGGRYVETDNGFGDTIAIKPGSGTYQVLFAYEMPYNRSLDLVQTMSVPVNAVVVLVPEGSIKVKGDGLVDAGTRPVQDVTYRMYNGNALAKGDQLELTITGRPDGGTSLITGGATTNTIVGLAVFGTVLILVGVWLFLRNRSRPLDDEPEAFEEEEFTAENAETVMDAILALDDLYQTGDLPADAYHKRRSELKARLQELL